MADFIVRLSSTGVEFVPSSDRAIDWMKQTGRLEEAAGAERVLRRDPGSATELAEEIHRDGLTWHDVEASGGSAPILPSAQELADRIAADTASTSDVAPTGANRFVDSPKGCLAIVVVLILGGILLLLSFCSDSKETGNAAPAEAQSVPHGPDESYIVAACDMTTKRFLVSSDSFDGAMGWDYSTVGGTAEVTRRYESTNGFGAKISSAYHCKFDIATDRVTFLQTVGPLGTDTLIGDAPRARGKKRSK